MRIRPGARRLFMGLSTVLGLGRRGFFIPYRYAALVPQWRGAYEAIETLFDSRREAFRGVLGTIDGLAADLQRIGEAPPPQPRWNQGWFPRLDGAAAYAMVRTLRPRRIVEVGSGHSTRFVVRAVRDGGLETEITTIDPAPRADIGKLGIALVASTVQEAGFGSFGGLADGDVLMIDSSHILMPGTDVDFLLNRVLPGLAAGVVVHVHDIFLPDDYPRSWDWRGYNEQLGITALIAGGGWEILFASRYVTTRMSDDVAATVLARLPLDPGAWEAGLWLRKL